MHFEQISAIFSGVQDLRKVFEAARGRRVSARARSFSWTKSIASTDPSRTFCPDVEDGTIILIGATTENPSFELNGALLSRAKVLVFKRLTDEAIEQLLKRAETVMGRRSPLRPIRGRP